LAAPFLGDDGGDFLVGDQTSRRRIIGQNERCFTGSTLEARLLGAPYRGGDRRDLLVGDLTSGHRIAGRNERYEGSFTIPPSMTVLWVLPT
jgi:hypothetical protein